MTTSQTDATTDNAARLPFRWRPLNADDFDDELGYDFRCEHAKMRRKLSAINEAYAEDTMLDRLRDSVQEDDLPSYPLTLHGLLLHVPNQKKLKDPDGILVRLPVVYRSYQTLDTKLDLSYRKHDLLLLLEPKATAKQVEHLHREISIHGTTFSKIGLVSVTFKRRTK